MKTIMMLYLIIVKKYSVMRVVSNTLAEWDGTWSACDMPMEFDFGHSGNWSEGKTPQDAVINLWKKAKEERRKVTIKYTIGLSGCPKCGSKKTVLKHIKILGLYYIKCADCDFHNASSYHAYASEEDARKNWENIKRGHE